VKNKNGYLLAALVSDQSSFEVEIATAELKRKKTHQIVIKVRQNLFKQEVENYGLRLRNSFTRRSIKLTLVIIVYFIQHPCLKVKSLHR
jgi:hypothetical protein